METLRGMVVRLHTGLGRYSGTDDALYVGVSGTQGGREFPLDVRWFDDFERRSRVKYALGEIWDDEALAGCRLPKLSKGGWNDPALSYIGFEGIDRVYLRKQTGRRRADDDAYELDEIEVTLFAEAPRRRLFRCSTAVWLGVQYGSTIWVPEVDPEELNVSLRA